VQDMLGRSVYWFLFPLLTIPLIIIRMQYQPLSQLWQSTMINIGFLSIQLLILTAYFSLKNKKWINVTRQLVGWGDILFLISIAFYLSVFNYLFFYIASLIAVLSSWLIFKRVFTKRNEHIPLAGLQGLIFAVFLAADWWYKPFGLTSDNWLLYLITK
jgi:formate hydrogenlyase subunit 3/multisubunit Na+/H+ antiporter MnhD subunit